MNRRDVGLLPDGNEIGVAAYRCPGHTCRQQRRDVRVGTVFTEQLGERDTAGEIVVALPLAATERIPICLDVCPGHTYTIGKGPETVSVGD